MAQKNNKIKENIEMNGLFNENANRSIQRENEHKEKLKIMNNNILANIVNYNKFLTRNNNEVNVNANNNDVYRSYESIKENQFQKSLTEKRKESQKCNELNEIKKKEYIDIIKLTRENKQNNKKLYKICLDNQIVDKQKNNTSLKEKNEGNTLILPSYLYLNRPVPTYKKAFDTLENSKSSSQLYKQNDNSNTKKILNSEYYQKPTNIIHNPIVNPLSDFYYNKYLIKSASAPKLII